MINRVLAKSIPFMNTPVRYQFSATFLRMVENFFDRAALHTGIRADKLNFYKKAESVLKVSLPLVRGISCFIQITAVLRLFWHTDASIKHISYPPKEVPDTQKMSIMMKLKPWLVL